MTSSTTALPAPRRRIVLRTRGHASGGPITRLMSPSDLGQTLKPFVFLDIFDASGPTLQAMGEMPLHPHSGIATVTVFTEGRMRYHDPAIGSGTIGYGGVEWMRAGGGVWHGKEMTPDDVPQYPGLPAMARTASAVVPSRTTGGHRLASSG
jgi:redox-sensitive bicupin YhaK (pirin superfamily)